MQSKRKAIIVAIIASIGIHLLFLVLSNNIRMPSYQIVVQKAKRLFDIKTVKEKRLMRKTMEQIGRERAESLKFQSPFQNDLLMAYVAEHNQKMEKSGYSDQLSQVTKPVEVSDQSGVDYIRESKKDGSVIRQGKKRETRSDLVNVDKKPGQEDMARPEDFINTAQLSEEFFDKMPGFTPQLSTTTFSSEGGSEELSGLDHGYSTVGSRKLETEDLRETLVYNLSTYKDPKDGQQYFKIGLKVGEAGRDLISLPKEIIFLVDCSLSIKRKRLEQIKQGLQYSLTNLNPDDYFNIISFKDQTQQFQKNSVKPTPANIEAALKFVDDMTAGEKTDAYEALSNTVNTQKVVLPAYIIFFSDGKANRGITNSTEIINKISALNNGKVSIFAFSGGAWVNRYLLDFISFKNRGWTEYAKDINLIGDHVSRMYDKIKDPILLNMRYYASGLNMDDMFPKLLPDFFKGAEFTIYGKHNKDDKFLLQLLGDSDSEINEFVIEDAFSQSGKGDESIARNWAFNKIYHLISLLEKGRDNTKEIAEIKKLAKKFSIKVPYLSNFKN